ncbi:MAG: hypothetical protein LCH74_03600 [Proteobacteria bacterium]|nr:hypothetical protein [Pseudomonadota bacterium]
MIDYAKLLAIIETAGRTGPAFFDLAELVIATFTGGKQEAQGEALREALAAARARSDELHQAVQDKLAGAAGQ